MTTQEATPRGKGEILVIEDNRVISSLLSEMLSDEGFTISQATGGKESEKLLDENHFDLVITDIIMPDGDGIDIILKLRKECPETKIIAISGGGRISADTYLDMAEELALTGKLTITWRFFVYLGGRIGKTWRFFFGFTGDAIFYLCCFFCQLLFLLIFLRVL